MYPGFHAAHAPERPAIIMGGSGEVMTYAELEDESSRLANLFRASGLVPGDHLAVIMENDVHFLAVIWGGLRTGLLITTVNRHLTPIEAAHIVNDCGAKALVVSAQLTPLVTAVARSCPHPTLKLMIGGQTADFLDFDHALAAQSPVPPEAEPLGEFMLYSSGTTGTPKGVLRPLSGRSLDEGPATAGMLGALYGFNDETVYLSPAPLYHAAPLGFSTAVHALGGTVVIMERFDEMQALALIERHRVTVSQWVPTMFVRMLKHPKEEREAFDLSSQRLAIHAAAPCPVPVKEQMIDWWGPIVVEYYGGTEGVGLTICDSKTWLTHKGTVGRAVLGIIHICEPDGTELAPNQTGIVYFEQPERGFEYHGDPEKTAASRHPIYPNWTTMGDIGHVDDDGYLYLTDRTSFTVISGGVNIYPQEIENVLVLHECVLDAAVFGVPNEEFGEEVKAVIQLVPGLPEVDDEALRADIVEFCRERLAGYKVPHTVDFVPVLPRLPTGKLYKQALRDSYVNRSGTMETTSHR